MTAYLDAYIADPKDLKEGHGVEDIYARVPVLDDKGKILTWLCRVTEDQYRHLASLDLITTWATTTKIKKKKIKDKLGNDKDIPNIVFGGTLHSPGSPEIIPDDSVQVGDVIPSPEPLVVDNGGL
jgi:hypothetical protein